MVRRKGLTKKEKTDLLSLNAGVCCVCKVRGIGINFHHIDHDPSNNELSNIAILCVSDHDAHHRPLQYTITNHLELTAQKIHEYKNEWELFVQETRKKNPSALAVINVYGSPEKVHSARLVFQTVEGKSVLERLYHLLDGPVEQWANSIIEEVCQFSSNLKTIFIEDLLPIDYCASCNHSKANVLNSNMATKLTAPDWTEASICSIYINPEQASMALLISYHKEVIVKAHLHKCGRSLHFICDNYQESKPLRKKTSIRTQATRIVAKFLGDWNPGIVLIGTGDPDTPTPINDLVLPAVWEGAT